MLDYKRQAWAIVSYIDEGGRYFDSLFNFRAQKDAGVTIVGFRNVHQNN